MDDPIDDSVDITIWCTVIVARNGDTLRSGHHVDCFHNQWPTLDHLNRDGVIKVIDHTTYPTDKLCDTCGDWITAYDNY